MCGTLGVCQPGATPPPASSPTYPLDIGADIARLAAHDGITTSAWTAKILAAIRSLKRRLELPHAMSRAEGDANHQSANVRTGTCRLAFFLLNGRLRRPPAVSLMGLRSRSMVAGLAETRR